MRHNISCIKMAVLTISACGLISCASWGEFSPQRIDKLHEADTKRNLWFEKYIESILFVGMPEDEFVKLFTKNDSWNDPQKPYIIKHNTSSYIVLCPDGVKHRITFVDAKLDKFETLGYEKIPIIGSTAWDYTSLLRGFKYSDGLTVGMSEEEFLRNFSNAVRSKLKDGYVIQSEDGRKFGVEFNGGVLTHFWNTGNSSGKDGIPEFH